MSPRTYKRKLLGNVLLFFTLIVDSDCLSCYECNSHVDSRCADTVPPNSMKINCQGSKYTFCRKIDQQIQFEVNGLPAERRIVRSCGWDESRYKNECYDRSGYGGEQRVCSCYGDNCNGSNGRLSPASLCVLASPLAAIAIAIAQRTSFRAL